MRSTVKRLNAGKTRKQGGTSARPHEDAHVKHLIEVASNWYYWEQDEQFRFTAISGSILEKAGVDSRVFLGKTRWDLGNFPLTDGGTWDKHRALLDAHLPFTDFLFKTINRRGEARYISTSGQPMFDERGRFIGYRGISRDVTQRIRAERRLTVEHGVAGILAEAASIAEATPKILRLICETLEWSCGAYWVLDEKTQTLRSTDTWALPVPALDEFATATRSWPPLTVSGEGLVRRTCASARPQWIRNVTKEPSFLRARLAIKATLQSAFAFPIKVGAKVIGVMEFYSQEAPHEPDQDLLSASAYVGASIGQFCERKRAEESLLRFRAALDLSGDMIYLIDPETMRYIDFNETACRSTGYTREELLKLGPPDLSPNVDRKEFERTYNEAITNPDKVHTVELQTQSKRGLGVIESHRRAIFMGGQWIIVSTVRDITMRKRAEQAALRLRRMYAALGSTNEAILHAKSADELYRQVCDAAVDGGKFFTTAVLFPEPGTTRLKLAAVAGRATEALRQAQISIDEDPANEAAALAGAAFRTLAPCVSNDFLKDERMRAWQALASDAGFAAAAAVPLLREGGAIGTMLFYSNEKYAFDNEIVTLLQRMAENIAFALANFEREAERKRAEERIQYLATHDGLTGLPNRVMFGQLLSSAIQSARRYQRKFAVLFIDLDRFKVINDTLGHEGGDQLLRQVARRLRESLRESDTVARLGGDEFVVLVHEAADVEQTMAVARKILSTVMRPIVLSAQECRVTASIGIAVYPGDGEDEQTLMNNADIAMYHAKEEGKNNFQFHSARLKSLSLERLTLETNLRRALERNEFSLHYQAKLDLRKNVISGVEALLRWNSSELGSISPAQFIPIAEETGMIVPIGKWVLQTACRQNVAWQRDGLPAVCMAVNLSARQFSDENLLKDIADALKDSGMDPQLLELEITEGMVITNPERAVEVLTAIKQMGVRLAIDDFGTGYSSLGQLKNFPIDTLKVDRSFIREIPTDQEDKAITEAIIAMAKTLSLTVIAEGVETDEQASFLRSHGCDEMQGYYFSKPIPPESFAELLRRHSAAADS